MIYRYRETERNLRTEMGRIVDRAGVDRWPRIFQNLRVSRETELCRRFPLHVVAAWLGNTPMVAEKHYLNTTEEDFMSAAADSESNTQPNKESDTEVEQGGAKLGAIGAKVVRKQCCTERSPKEESPQIAGFCDSRQVDATYLAPQCKRSRSRSQESLFSKMVSRKVLTSFASGERDEAFQSPPKNTLGF